MRLRAEFVARTLALSWAAFWLFFLVTESLVWHTPLRVMAVWVAMDLVFVVLALAAWRWEVTGGLLLVAAGVLAGASYAIWPPSGLPLLSVVITTVVLSVRPLAAGLLFLVHGREVASHA